MKLEQFKQTLINDETQGYEVGGFLRDLFHNEFHQTNKISYDVDYVVCGYDIASFESSFPEAFKIGTEAAIIENGVEKTERTPVYLLDIDGVKCEVALARNEQKVSDGYSGFAFTYGKEITILDDLARRDFTVNAIARNLVTMEVVDPFDGRADVKNKIIRGIFVEEKNKTIKVDLFFDETNKEFLIKQDGKTFSSKLPQDPVRALRAARLAAKLGYSIDAITQKSLKHLKKEIQVTHPNRIYAETKKAMLSDHPEDFFRHLANIDLLEDVFPEVANLSGLEQHPDFHPEGDAFVHTLQVVSAASILTKKISSENSESLERNVLSALLHDIGKKPAQTYDNTKGRFQYLEHEKMGVPLAEDVIERFQLKKMENHLLTNVRHHMYLHSDLGRVKTSKLLFHLIGGYKSLALTPQTIEAISNSTISPEDFKSVGNEDEMRSLIKLKESNFKKHQRDFNVSLRFKEILKEKSVNLKNFDQEKDKKSYLRSKILNASELSKWNTITKTKGVTDYLNLTDYLIVCAADTLGRLKNADQATAVFEYAGDLMALCFNSPNESLTGALENWKKEFGLTSTYVEQFELFLKNAKKCIKLFSTAQNTTVDFDFDYWVVLNKKPDEIALLKDNELKGAIRRIFATK